jgi:putative tryptophan/tyrosine transport system substrate-binding protein
VRRGGFIAVLGGAALWPLAGQAQRAEWSPRVGVLLPLPESDPMAQAFLTAFAQALGRYGWAEGKNVRIDYRFAAGDPALFKTYAAELVGLSPDAVVASTGPAAAALRAQTRGIPIGFCPCAKSCRAGFCSEPSATRGNLTGFISWDAPLMGRWLQLLKEVAPSITRVAVIFNPDTAFFNPVLNREIEAAAASFGVTVALAPVRDDPGIAEPSPPRRASSEAA